MPSIKQYYKIWIVGFMCFAAVLTLHRKAHFSPAFLDFMILKNSTFKAIDDPCKFQLPADPIEPDRYQIRVNLFCHDGRIAWNTLAFTSLRDKTMGGAIKEVARIHGFPSDLILTWECKVSGKVIPDWKSEIYQGNWIECHEA